MDPKGKVALVTGGTSGIGFDFCKAFLKEGGKGVALCATNEDRGNKKMAELKEEFGNDCAIFIKTDVTKQNEFEEAFKKTISVFKNIDIVLNNAGIFNDENWERTVDINVKGVIRGLLLTYKYLGKDKGGNGGTIINVSSVAGLSPGVGIPIYSGLKSSIVGLTNAFGNDFYRKNTDIRVMAICPGMTDSNIEPPHNCLLVPEWKSIVLQYFKPENMQSVNNVSKALLHMIREGNHGSIWVSVDEKPPQEVSIPFWEELRIMKEN